jgi:Dolichyl-phosphate-mannose-protein mannosyltransferase
MSLRSSSFSLVKTAVRASVELIHALVRRTGAWIAVSFLIIGLPFLRQAGLHYDASFELACFYPCSPPVFRAHVFGRAVPLMIIQYLGALKAWLYMPLLKYFVVTPFLLRLPSLIAGAGSVWLLFAILDRVCGRRAAVAGALLLATDASFLIATSYDFGPIALLHLFILAGIFLVLRFESSKKSGYLALAFFCFGLALWYKALVVWMLGGLAAASAAVFPRRILALLSPARVAIAAGAFSCGALPLIYYNVVTAGATLHPGNITMEAAPLQMKALILRRTLDGSAFFSWLTEDRQPGTMLAPKRIGSKASVAVSRAVGQFRSNWMFFAAMAACCLLPWLWFTPSRQAALFALIYLAVTWALMLILPGTGAALHHDILLWPFPHFLIAVAGAQLAQSLGRRLAPVIAMILAAVVSCNLLLINNYYSALVTQGTTALWTDAIYPLFDYLASSRAAEVVTVDWGYETTLCLLSDGRMPIKDISFLLLQPTDEQTKYVRSLMVRPSTLFVDYAYGGEQFPGVHNRIDQIAAGAGFRKMLVARIRDRNQRPRFEVARYFEGTIP